MGSWELSWEALFVQPASSEGQSTGPRLGVNYVQASAPFTSIGLPHASELSIGQDLAKYGIAGVVWNCARAMVSFFQSEPQLVADRHVLELGAGPGAVGLALAASGSGVASLLLTDLAHVVPLTRENARNAGLQHVAIAAMLSGSCRLDVHELCWGEPLNVGVAARPVDVVVASDCLYESTAHLALLSTLLELTDPSRQAHQRTGAATSRRRHSSVFLAYKQRMPTKERAFFEVAAGHFEISVYSTSSNGDNCQGDAPIEFCNEAIFICKFERRCSAKEASAHLDDADRSQTETDEARRPIQCTTTSNF